MPESIVRNLTTMTGEREPTSVSDYRNGTDGLQLVAPEAQVHSGALQRFVSTSPGLGYNFLMFFKE